MSSFNRMASAGKASRFFRKYAWVCTTLFVFFSPFPRITSIKEICYYSAVAAMIVPGLRKGSHVVFKTPLSVPFALFALWAAGGIFFSLHLSNSIHDIYAHLIKYVILYLVLINTFNSPSGLRWLAWDVVLSAALFCTLGLIYYYGYLGHPFSQRFAMHFTEGRDMFAESPTNLIGVMTVFAVILCFQLLNTEPGTTRKTVLMACLFSLIAGSLMTQTRSTVIALLVGIFVQFYSKKKIVFGLVGVLAAAVFFTPIISRFDIAALYRNERIGLGLISMEIIKDYPVAGTGFGIQSYKEQIDRQAYNLRLPEKYRLERWQVEELAEMHNMFLSVAVRTGLIGLFLFSLIFVSATVTCLKLFRQARDEEGKSWAVCALACLLAFLAKSLFEPVFNHFSEVYCYTILSIITILWLQVSKKAAVPSP